MKKNPSKSSVFTAVLFPAILIIVLACLSSCSDDKPQPPPHKEKTSEAGSAPGNATKNKGDSEKIAAMEKFASIEFPVQKTSFDKIDEDLENGKISKEKAVELYLIAGYYPERLPPAYKSEHAVTGDSEIMDAKMWIHENRDLLDDKTKETLEPFYVPAHHPKSHFNKTETELKRLIDLLTLIPEAGAAEPPAFLTVTVNGKEIAYVYYRPADEERAKWSAQAILDAWEKFHQYLGVEPGVVELNFVTGSSWYGLAWSAEIEGKMTEQIEIRDDMPEKKTKSVVVHELFHSFQFTLGIKSNTTEQKWIMETTAVWSENYIYPEFNREQEYLSTFFYYLPYDLICHKDAREYGNYLFMLFLNQRLQSDVLIKDMLVKSMTVGATRTVEELPGFDDLFAEFAQWNINRDELKLYKDYPAHLPDISYDGYPSNPYGKARALIRHTDETVWPLTVSLEKGGIKYHTHTFPETLKKIIFRLPEGNDKNRMTALIELEDNTRYIEDWTHAEERTFCKNIPFENVETLTLIFSNSDLHANYDARYEVETKRECDETGYGTTVVLWNDSKTQTSRGTKGSAETTQVNRGSFSQRDVIRYDGQGDYEVVRQSVSFSSLTGTYIKGDGSCGWDHDNRERELKGSYFRNFEKPGSRPTKIRVELDENDKKTNRFYFETSPNTPNYNWVSSTATTDTLWVPCDSGVPPKKNFNVIHGASKTITLPVDPFDLTNDPENTHISGTRVYNGNGYDATLTYDYVLKK